MITQYKLISKKTGYVTLLAHYDDVKNDLRCWEVTSWDCDDHSQHIDLDFVADVYLKWDACTHWWMRGEDYSPSIKDSQDGYYHICGPICLETHILSMVFIWHIGRSVHSKLHSLSNEYYSESEFVNGLIRDMLKNYTIDILPVSERSIDEYEKSQYII